MGIIAANENKLDTAANKLNIKLKPTYFLYGGTNRFNNIQKLFIILALWALFGLCPLFGFAVICFALLIVICCYLVVFINFVTELIKLFSLTPNTLNSAKSSLYVASSIISRLLAFVIHVLLSYNEPRE